jgi:hypothetical protein
MRNKKMQARYDTWMIGMKEKYGSTGKSSQIPIFCDDSRNGARALISREIPHPSPTPLGLK